MSDDFFARRCPNCNHLIQVATEAQQTAFKLICQDIAKQRDWPEKSGHFLDPKQWQQLMIAAWEREHDRQFEVLPSIDRHDFDVVFRRASRLSKDEMGELIPFAEAWCAENGIKRGRSWKERNGDQA